MQTGVAQSDTYVRFLAWAQANQKRLILWGAIVVIVMAAGVFFVYYQGQKEMRASIALSNVRAPLNPGSPMPAGAAEEYLKIAREHAGTKAAARALLLGAAALFIDGKYAEAQKTFEQFLREYPESEWVPKAHFGIASTLDAQGKAAEAIAKFDEIRRRFANDAVIDEVKLALGRLYENQNKPEEAHKIYAELVQANAYSGMGSEAGVRKEELEAKFPQLRPASAPPPVLTPPALTALTNRPALTNRVISISNVPPRATNVVALKPATNAAAKPGTNVPLLLQPQPAPAPAQPAPIQPPK